MKKVFYNMFLVTKGLFTYDCVQKCFFQAGDAFKQFMEEQSD